MSIRVGGTDSARWGSHIASVHLRRDWQQLTVDAAAGADEEVLAADRAAILESHREVATQRRGTRFDVTA